MGLEDEAVWFSLTAASRPSALLMRIGGPVTRRLQEQANDAYVAALLAS